jgi:ureidoacrylate peracid hydrolase
MPSVAVEASPEAPIVNPQHTAVIVVDMQHDFCSEGGMFASAGIDLSAIRAIIEPISRTLSVARAAGARVIYLKMEFRPDLSDVGPLDSPQRQRIGVSQPADGFLIRGSWNTEIIPELKPQPNDIIVSKRRFSGFYETELDMILKTLGITTLVFTGATTSVCVESTLRDAAFRDYACLLLADCTAEPIGADQSRSNHSATLLVTETSFGWVSNSACFTNALRTLATVSTT